MDNDITSREFLQNFRIYKEERKKKEYIAF